MLVDTVFGALLGTLFQVVGSDPAALEGEPLPSVEELAFETLEGDFDGDGQPDEATAHQTESGVQISLTLSSSTESVVHDLGVGSLEELTWTVVQGEADTCDEPEDAVEPCPPPQDMIEVTPFGAEPFLLRWDGEALETLFPEA